MKRINYFLATVSLLAWAFTLPTKLTTPVQPAPGGPTQTAYVLKRIPSSAVHHQQTARPRRRLWESTSSNWSGYAVPREGSSVTDTFSNVQGTWTVPAVTGTRGSITYSSAWVGLDGYEDGTVEQTGTEHDWVRQGQQNYAWFEMYPGGAYEITGFPVSPGDSITAEVQYVGQKTIRSGRGQNAVESVFQLTIVNTTKKVSYAVPTSYTTIPSAARSSAEWVMEAPSSRSVLPLADFGAIKFSGCQATSTGSDGQPGAIDFWPSDPLTMVNPSGQQATPSALNEGTAFTVTWAP